MIRCSELLCKQPSSWSTLRMKAAPRTTDIQRAVEVHSKLRSTIRPTVRHSSLLGTVLATGLVAFGLLHKHFQLVVSWKSEVVNKRGQDDLLTRKWAGKKKVIGATRAGLSCWCIWDLIRGSQRMVQKISSTKWELSCREVEPSCWLPEWQD